MRKKEKKYKTDGNDAYIYTTFLQNGVIDFEEELHHKSKKQHRVI